MTSRTPQLAPAGAAPRRRGALGLLFGLPAATGALLAARARGLGPVETRQDAGADGAGQPSPPAPGGPGAPPDDNPLSAPARYLLGAGGALGPATAFELPVGRRAELQEALDTHRVVRLQRGDYAAGATAPLTLSSGQELYAPPGQEVTGLPPVVIAPGARNVILSGGHPESITFPPSEQVTRHNVLLRVWTYGGVLVDGAALEDNLFVSLKARLRVDTRTSGYARNNRFIANKYQGGDLHIEMLGDPSWRSGNNVFLWYNSLTPEGSTAYLENQADVAIVGLNTEAWNWHNASGEAMLKTGPMGHLRFFVGEASAPPTNNLGQATRLTPVFDVAADAFQAWDYFAINQTGRPAVIYRRPNTVSAVVSWDDDRGTQDLGVSPTRFAAFVGDKQDATVNGRSVSSQASASEQAALRRLFVAPAGARPGRPWERPAFGPIPDPAGPDWRRELAHQPDHTSYIQGLIDAGGVARLPAGIFYIARPLRLRAGQGLIGAGAAHTAIIAKSPTIDMIVGADQTLAVNLINNVVLADLTLQGGKNGLHLDANGSGPGAQYVDNVLSHVTFRDMVEAGLFVDGVMSLDNNYFDHLDFVGNGAGLLQRVPSWPGHGDQGASHLDKNVFFHARFVGNGKAVDLIARRVNVLNAWINCLFKDNRDGAADLHNSLSTLFANCDFVNNGGDAVVRSSHGHPASFVSCHFRADARGRAMLAGPANVEGTVFERGESSGATILTADPREASFYNSRSEDMPLGPLQTGLLLNSHFALDSPLSQQGVLVRDGRPVTFLGGQPDPLPQLLFGGVFY